MVKEMQTVEEFFDNDIDTLVDSDFMSVDSDNMQENTFISSLLGIFAALHTKYFNLSSDEVLKQINKDSSAAIIKLNSIVDTKMIHLITTFQEDILQNNGIDLKLKKRVNLDINLSELKVLVKDTLKATVYQFRNDVTVKAKTFMTYHKKSSAFHLQPNFKRSIKRVKNTIKFNMQYAKQKVDRKWLQFKHGEDSLFYWRVRGVNTCNWCYSNELLPPKLMSEWELDHPNGHCSLEPVNDETTTVYQDLLADSNVTRI